MEEKEFIEKFRDVFEHSEWIPRQGWKVWNREKRGGQEITPAEGYRVMVEVVRQAGEEEQLSLLRAHPQLAGKEAQDGELTSHSAEEQSGAGLDRLSREEIERISRWNREYLDKFGFPFIIAVRQHTKEGIFREFRKRLQQDRETEIRTALQEVFKIAKIRLNLDQLN